MCSTCTQACDVVKSIPVGVAMAIWIGLQLVFPIQYHLPLPVYPHTLTSSHPHTLTPTPPHTPPGNARHGDSCHAVNSTHTRPQSASLGSLVAGRYMQAHACGAHVHVHACKCVYSNVAYYNSMRKLEIFLVFADVYKLQGDQTNEASSRQQASRVAMEMQAGAHTQNNYYSPHFIHFQEECRNLKPCPIMSRN